jgi:hypothetical protein
LATGEEVPRGHSLRARLLILDIIPADVNRDLLSECQRAANEGLFAAAMGAYLAWIAGRYEELRARLHSRVNELRSLAYANSIPVHARLPTTLAELQSGWEIWLQFALEVGAISSTERDQLQRRSEKALDELAVLQVSYNRGSDPALRFLTLLPNGTGKRKRSSGGPAWPSLGVLRALGMAQAGWPDLASAGNAHRLGRQ